MARKILVVEDDRNISDLIRMYLEKEGFEVQTAFDGGTAVEITLTGSVISSLSLRLRTYTATSELSLLLPLPQALTIAAQHPGAELSIGYPDSGASSVSACWLSD